MINVEVQRHGNENVLGLMRRFSRKVQGAGIIKHVRGLRYFSRKTSGTQVKKDALARMEKTALYHELIKQGREIPDKKRR